MAPGSEPTGAPLPVELRPLSAKDPRTIGPYRVAGRLRQGRTGTVYGAVDDAGRCVAVTVLRPEAVLLRQVGGVCTVAVLSADTEADVPWAATGFVPGATPADRVRRDGPLRGEMLTAFAAGTAEALAAVHAAGVVHGGVEPGTVVLSPEGPRLLESGIGVPDAAAPTADVFAWGALVAHAATGRSPFASGGTGERENGAAGEEPDLTGVPEGLVPMLRAALSADPAARPDAESIYRGLVDYTTPEDISAVPTPELADRLRDLFSRVWTDAGAEGHDPQAWAAAAGDGAAAPAMGTAGAGKVAAVVAAAVIGTAGVGIGGLFVAREVAGASPRAEASPSPSPERPPTPEEAVAGAVDLLETTESYLVRADQPGEPGLPRFQSEYVHRADPDFYQVHETGGTDSADMVFDAERDRRLVAGPAYAPAFTVVEDPDAPDPKERVQGAVLEPFDDLVASMEVAEDGEGELDGAPARLIEGTYTGTVTDPMTGEDTGEERAFSLWFSESGEPLRLEYAPAAEEGASGDAPGGGDAEADSSVWTYGGFGGGLDAWNCGTVDTAGGGSAALVTNTADLSCTDARSVAERFAATPSGDLVGDAAVAEIDDWTCGGGQGAEAGNCTADGPNGPARIAMIDLE